MEESRWRGQHATSWQTNRNGCSFQFWEDGDQLAVTADSGKGEMISDPAVAELVQVVSQGGIREEDYPQAWMFALRCLEF